eukprot:gnl/TRDRNA2_/TRDRNA2_130676_c0_seq1.p1 gnl/TRDRNA2_/TRDRNA2_130676_c0~~gnl/TRDRNA2_/TRDRNA2_130676_c0_seq1.p1  ORF type:complete len:1115 (-),score=249.91 gnl/TRDRNA2_/TRDRNA2_130676_c0_seq1:22-3366(-)
MLPPFSGIDEAAVTFTDHAWAEPGDGTMFACGSEGSVWVLSSQELNVICEITTPFQDASGMGSSVPHAVRCFSQGFLLGGSGGTLAVWERVEGSPDQDTPDDPNGPKEFRHIRTMRVNKTESPICCIDMTGAEESLVLGFRNADIGHMSMASLYMSSDEDVSCMVVSGGFHAGPVVGLDVAAQRPLIASACKKDQSIRIWNYVTKQCELRWEFTRDPPTSVAIHPLGYFVVVGFSDKLRYFQVLVNELRLHREFAVRGTRLLRFSHGGHLLVAAYTKFAVVYSTRTLSKIAMLHAHQMPISSISFDPDDHVVVTCGEDGLVCQWDTATWEKVAEHSMREVNMAYQYQCVSVSSSGVACLGAWDKSHGHFRRFKDCVPLDDVELPGHTRITSLCHYSGCGATLAGTSSGALWIYPQNGAPGFHTEYGLHGGTCSWMRLSVDGRFLITAGDDGTIFILGMTGLGSGGDHSLETSAESDSRAAAAEAVLINKSEITQLQDQFSKLQTENGSLKVRLAEEAAKLEEECRIRVGEARQADEAEIHELSRRCEALHQATTAKERESHRVLEAMKSSHKQARGQLEKLYDKKLSHEADRYLALEAERYRLEQRLEEIESETEKQSKMEADHAQQELERRLAEKDMEIQKHKDLIAFSQHRFDGMLDVEGLEHDVEIADIKKDSLEELERRKRVEEKLKNDQDQILQGLDLMEKDRERAAKEQHELSMAIGNLQTQTEDTNRTVNSLKNERRERESTLHDKEAKIDSYKVKVNTLKKFKHVLDKRLREVTQLLEPKDTMIEQLRAHLRELEGEFEKQLTDQRAMEGVLDSKKQQIAFLTSENRELNEQVENCEKKIIRFRTDLHNLITENDDVRKWPAEIRRLYHAHVCGHTSRQDRLALEELQRQMRLMERKVTSLSVKGGQMESTCKLDMQRKANENSLLVHELNQLRVQKKSMQSHVQSLEKKLGEVEKELAKVSSDNKLQLTDGANATAPAGIGAPRTPSSRPGPRQLTNTVAMGETVPQDSKRATNGGIRKGPTSKMSLEERKKMQGLLRATDLHSQQIQMQRLENKLLRDQVERLLAEREKRTGEAQKPEAETSQTMDATLPMIVTAQEPAEAPPS